MTTDQGRIFGYHLRIELGGCDLDKVRNGHEILSWAQRLVSPDEGIDMKPYGEPWLDHFGPEPGKIGWTLFFPITASNLLVHANDDGSALFDIFSCNWFDPDKAIEFTAKFFGSTVPPTHDFKIRRVPQKEG